MPERIQLRRTKGWRMPANTIRVSRPGPWGNPWRGQHAVKAFRDWLETGAIYWPTTTELLSDNATVGPCRLTATKEMTERRKVLLARLPELRGRNLGCWCPLGKECHAEVLLELANRNEEQP
jgi:hypothetical protein